MRRRLTAAAVSVALAVTLTQWVAAAGVAASGPSVELPDTDPVAVMSPGMVPRDPDEAASRALSGDQPASTAPIGSGDFTASPLSRSGSWSAGGQSGSFSWSYPLRVPPAAGGLEPSLGLGYSSAAVDGLTSATNNQPGWAGDGWGLGAGFVERGYRSCAGDKDGGVTPPATSGDLCWGSDNAVLSLNGRTTMMIRDTKTGSWRAEDDDGSKIERLFGAANGDNNGEHWRITTTDGTQYFFGIHPEAKSTWTVPVFGDDAGEPCHNATFASAHCVQGWRWMLDRVVDRHGNAMRYYYTTETNHYRRNNATVVPYTRAGYLTRVDYGLRTGNLAGQPTGRVVLDLANRCVPGSECTASKKDNWPDVPWDAKCDAGKACSGQVSPTFWATKRLSKIITKVWKNSAWSDVDSWTLRHTYPDPNDGGKAALWLAGITHTGRVGGSISLPEVTFEGTALPNRIEKIDGAGWLYRYRVTAIRSETGGLTVITYGSDCSPASLPADAHTNTKQCYQAKWAPPGASARTNWFYKYVVTAVTDSDQVSGSLAVQTAYQYLDGAAWAYDKSEFTKAEDRTWNSWRGYARVATITGSGVSGEGRPEAKARTEERFYRGMHGDRKAPAGGTRTVTVTDSAGKARTDHEWLNGVSFEQATFDGDGGAALGKTISEPWWRGPTATRGAFKAYLVRTKAVDGHTKLASGTWRKTRTETTFDNDGYPTQVNDLGEVGTPDDDRCTTTAYTQNLAGNLKGLPRQSDTVAVACGKTPSYPSDYLTGTRLFYDGRTDAGVGATGNVTRVEVVKERPAAGPVYLTAATVSYDGLGRTLQATDTLGRKTTTSYSPATGGPVTKVVTKNNLGHTTQTQLEPAWGAVVKQLDPNGKPTEATYDALGRRTEAWLPGRDRSANQRGNTRWEYLIRDNAPSAIATTSLAPTGRYVTSYQIFDGLLRPRQTQAPAHGGGRLLTETRYDTHGRAYATSGAYFNNADPAAALVHANHADIPALTVTEYDGAGRAVKEIFKKRGYADDKWQTTIGYGGDRVTVTPPQGASATTKIANVRGQITQLLQYPGREASGSPDITRYAHTKAGELATVTDPAGNTWSYEYDLLGRQTKSVDPDKGATTMTYDTAGQLLTSTDARGVTLAFGYDGLGRKTALHEGSLSGPKRAAWSWDTVPSGKGHLASSTRYANGRAYTSKVLYYDATYQPAETQVDIPAGEGLLAGSYKVVHDFAPDGTRKSTSLPAAGGLPRENILHRFTDLGPPDFLGVGNLNLVSDAQYTRYGEIARLQLGETASRTWISYLYDDTTRRLNRKVIDTEVAAPNQADYHYTYDPAGNITSIADRPLDQAADNQCFRYDHLRRLTVAFTPGDGDCASNPAVNPLGGPAPYWHWFFYDKTGNRTKFLDLRATGDITHTYTYPEAGSAQPHAVQEATTEGPAVSQQDSYTYDASGNTTGRTLAGAGQTLTWDPEGKVSKVTIPGGSDVEYLYDADGNRLIRRDAEGATLYLEGQDVRLHRSSGNVSATRYYSFGDTTVAARDASGLTWLTSDHQGTPTVSVNAETLEVTKHRQDPFGNPRGTEVSFPGDRTFVGGTKEPTGLTHIGAREYDPALGRFISVDPIMDLTDPQQMHGYSYSNNSPITLSDPTGLFSCCSIPNPFKAVTNAISKVSEGIGSAVRTVGEGIGNGAHWVGRQAWEHRGTLLAVAGTVCAFSVACGVAAAGIIGGLTLVNSAHSIGQNCFGKFGGTFDGVSCGMEVLGLATGGAGVKLADDAARYGKNARGALDRAWHARVRGQKGRMYSSYNAYDAARFMWVTAEYAGRATAVTGSIAAGHNDIRKHLPPEDRAEIPARSTRGAGTPVSRGELRPGDPENIAAGRRSAKPAPPPVRKCFKSGLCME